MRVCTLSSIAAPQRMALLNEVSAELSGALDTRQVLETRGRTPARRHRRERVQRLPARRRWPARVRGHVVAGRTDRGDAARRARRARALAGHAPRDRDPARGGRRVAGRPAHRPGEPGVARGARREELPRRAADRQGRGRRHTRADGDAQGARLLRRRRRPRGGRVPRRRPGHGQRAADRRPRAPQSRGGTAQRDRPAHHRQPRSRARSPRPRSRASAGLSPSRATAWRWWSTATSCQVARVAAPPQRPRAASVSGGALGDVLERLRRERVVILDGPDEGSRARRA